MDPDVISFPCTVQRPLEFLYEISLSLKSNHQSQGELMIKKKKNADPFLILARLKATGRNSRQAS